MGAAIALALVATLVSAINPGLLIAVPLALLLVALAPARSPYRLIGVLVLVLLFATPASGALWYAERGWALTLGAVFLAVVALRPGRAFLGRGIAAVALTSLIGGAVLLGSGAWRRVEWAIARRFREAASAWTMLVRDSGDPALRDAGDTLRRVAELEVMLYPAMLAIASLAALAVAWWGYRRLTESDGAPLAPTRAATFMAVLYVLRGAAIVIALTGVGGAGMFLMGVMAVLLLPLVASAALIIGLSDTWLDLRRRASSDDAASS